MNKSGDAPTNSKSSQWLILAASLIFTAVSAYVAMNRDDTRELTRAVQAIDSRVTTIEARMEERRLRRDEREQEIFDRLRALEGRRPR